MARILFALIFSALILHAQSVQVASTLKAGQDVEVQFSGAQTPRDFICIVAKDTPEGKYTSYQYTGKKSSVTLQAPEEPGEYEVRVLSATSPYPTLARSAFTATPVTASLKAASSVDPGTDIEFTWEGPNNRKDFITIVKKGAPEKKYGTYVYVRGGSPQKIRVGEEPGDWELRYLTGVERRTLASHPFTIGALAAATIAAPANVKAGADFTFTWTGPSNTKDFITLVPKGTPERKYERYVYARGGSPASLRAPDEAG